jgi:two-component system sensor histidine kinase SenX3
VNPIGVGIVAIVVGIGIGALVVWPCCGPDMQNQLQRSMSPSRSYRLALQRLAALPSAGIVVGPHDEVLETTATARTLGLVREADCGP